MPTNSLRCFLPHATGTISSTSSPASSGLKQVSASGVGLVSTPLSEPERGVRLVSSSDCTSETSQRYHFVPPAQASGEESTRLIVSRAVRQFPPRKAAASLSHCANAARYSGVPTATGAGAWAAAPENVPTYTVWVM